jgi:hypothetical protein
MKPDAEKIVIAAGLIFLAFASMETFATSGQKLTREEAIEISRNSPLVQESFENSDYYAIEVHPPDERHDTWEITWYIHPIGAPSAAAIGVTQNIDELTGEIVAEGSIGLR